MSLGSRKWAINVGMPYKMFYGDLSIHICLRATKS